MATWRLCTVPTARPPVPRLWSDRCEFHIACSTAKRAPRSTCQAARKLGRREARWREQECGPKGLPGPARQARAVRVPLVKISGVPSSRKKKKNASWELVFPAQCVKAQGHPCHASSSHTHTYHPPPPQPLPTLSPVPPSPPTTTPRPAPPSSLLH